MKKLIIFVFAMTVAFIGHSQWIGWLQTDSIVDYGGTDYIRLTSTGIGINKTPTAQFDVNGIALATHLYIQSGGVLSFTNNWAVDGDGIRMFGGDMDFHVNSPLISRLAINQYGDVTAQRDFITTADVQADSGKFNTMVATTVGAGIYALNVSGESDLDSLGFNPLPVATARDSILSIDRSTNKWIVASPKSEFGSYWELDGLSLINDTANSDTVRVPDGQLEIGASATTTGQLTLHSSSLAVATINMSNVSGDFKFDDEIFVGNSANASPGIWDYNGMSSGNAAFRNILNTNGGFGGAAAEPEIIVAGVPELTVTATDVTAADDLIATDTLEVLSSNLWTADEKFNLGTGNVYDGIEDPYQVAIGINNDAGGDYNYLFGSSLTAANGYDRVFFAGTIITALADNSYALGTDIAVNGYGFGVGLDLALNAPFSCGFGEDHIAGSEAAFSFLIGDDADADVNGEFVHSSDDYSGHGQAIDVNVGDVVTHSTSDWYSLSIDGAGGSDRYRLTIPASTVWTFTALIVGTNDAQSETFSYKIEGHIKRDGVNNTTLMASTVTTIYESTATFDAQAVADDTNEALLIQVSDSGAGSDIIRWTCKTTIAEQTF